MTVSVKTVVAIGVCLVLGLLVWRGFARMLSSWAESRPRWSGAEVAPLWFTPLQPRGEPVVVGDTVLVVANGADGIGHLVAIEAGTGGVRWRSAVPVEAIVDANTRHVVVREPSGAGHVLSLRSGEVIAEATPDTWVAVRWAGDLGFGVSRDGRLGAFAPAGILWAVPAVITELRFVDDIALTDNQVVVRAHARQHEGPYALVGYDRASGAERWRYAGDGLLSLGRPLTTSDAVFLVREGPSRSTSEVTRNADGSTTSRTIAGLGEHRLVSLDATTGAIRFDVPIAGAGRAALPCLLAVEGSEVTVRAWSDDGHDRVRGYATADGRAVWDSEPGGGSVHLSRAVLAGGLLAVRDRRGHSLVNEAGTTTPDSSLFVIDAKSGQELWHSTMFELMDMGDPVRVGGLVVAWVAPSDGGTGDSKGEAGIVAWKLSRDGR